ncbi:ParB/RepB/Spo0J family partition protein [Elusimicrobiota bacterium]
MAKKVLGRGLDSLIPEKETDQLREINIDRIVPNDFQMRTEFNEEKINEMVESIKKEGIIQPIVVTKKGNKYMLIAGERRWRAAKKAGFTAIPCIEKDLEGESLLTLSLIENIQREDLTPVEEASAYERMIKEFSWTQQEVSEKVGKSRSAIANILRILSLPDELIDFITSGRITAGHAKALLSVRDDSKRIKLAQRIVKEKLTVRDAENLASLINNKKKRNIRKTHKNNSAPELQYLEEKLEKILGTKICIKKNRKEKGVLIIEFYSASDFERITDIICGT